MCAVHGIVAWWHMSREEISLKPGCGTDVIIVFRLLSGILDLACGVANVSAGSTLNFSQAKSNQCSRLCFVQRGAIASLKVTLGAGLKVHHHEKYIQWRLNGSPAPPITETLPLGIVYGWQLKMMKNPTLKAVRLTCLVTDYGTKFFRNALARYIFQLNYPGLSQARIEACLQDLSFSFNSFPPEDSIINSIYVQPSKTLKNGELLPAQFDTVLINDGTGGIMVETPGLAASKSGHGGSGQEVGCRPGHPTTTGVSGYCVVQIHVIFIVGQHHLRPLFLPGIVPPKYVTYVEWFSLFTTPEPDHLMNKINRSPKDGERLARPTSADPSPPPPWEIASPNQLIFIIF
ncbi:hypothetical protein B0H14DRAFT_2640088 [Mycena olivaceomarginata]|nr:hypothetical protein B0H14DRAFT_2640088 [Mycena olivaceomarginata]